MIDSFYYSDDNVDERTVSRFYGYTLEDPGAGAFRQLDPYLQYGHMLSADGTVDYAAHAGEGHGADPDGRRRGGHHLRRPLDRADLRRARQPDKTLLRFGRPHGQVADYGHCDLVWSRHAPREIFPPIIDWLDQHQPGRAVAARTTLAPPVASKAASASPQQ